MATQGVLSIVCRDKVLFKIVCGCDGYNIDRLAALIVLRKLNTTKDLYNAAVESGLGCKECLVVMSGDAILYRGGGPVGPLYRDMFADPEFNPRWEHGSADCRRILTVEGPEYEN